MVCSDEVSYKSALSGSNHDRKSDAVSIVADFSNDPLISNDILNRVEENISEESNLNVISNIICPHNAFVSCGKVVQCEARVLKELDFDYNSCDFISNVVHTYHEVTSNESSNQCEKYVLKETTLLLTWGYGDLTLFRVGR
ncbi:unnamed protein product [Schistosoma curassoni]|uniref:DUF4806 domain-containing protein n=1 Tax=Schistosoma curassoni TaxID=6186 RepID=A0A183KRE9_9TREM|nr:unnamed protein product [Schistosoma curassoni]